MEQLAYERPREKLQTRGAAYVTTTELVQIIIGSGSMYVSGARLAKQATRLIENNEFSFAELCSIKGIGSAKASQLVAAIELGRRIALANKIARSKTNVLIPPERITRAIGTMRKLGIHIYFFDGSHKEVFEKSYSVCNNETLSVCVQRIAKDALEVSARSLIAAIGSKRDSLVVTTTELSLIKQLRDTAELISIIITAVYRANATVAQRWSDI